VCQRLNCCFRVLGETGYSTEHGDIKRYRPLKLCLQWYVHGYETGLANDVTTTSREDLIDTCTRKIPLRHGTQWIK